VPRSEDHQSLGPKNGAGRDDDEEVMSPLKQPKGKMDGSSHGAAANRKLFQGQKEDKHIVL
jgi:hypothetical protein